MCNVYMSLSAGVAADVAVSLPVLWIVVLRIHHNTPPFEEKKSVIQLEGAEVAWLPVWAVQVWVRRVESSSTLILKYICNL